jgi:hypothetical protein
MTGETTTTPQKAEPDRGKSGYRSSSSASIDSRTQGGSGVQRSHLRDRKTWLKGRTRAGKTWAERKAASATHCPSKAR